MKRIIISLALILALSAFAANSRQKKDDGVDPAISQIQKVAKQQRNRYEVLSAVVKKYDPHRTNMTARVARQSMQAKLNDARKEAKKAEKVQKAAEKAKAKDKKNFDKWVSDTQKAKAKSSDDMAEFYDSVLELAGEGS